jgi:hypothetical protein
MWNGGIYDGKMATSLRGERCGPKQGVFGDDGLNTNGQGARVARAEGEREAGFFETRLVISAQNKISKDLLVTC